MQKSIHCFRAKPAPATMVKRQAKVTAADGRISRAWLLVLLLGVCSWLSASAVALNAAVARSSEPDQHHTISYDRYSLKIDGKRIYIWSGSFHYWRLPSPDLWKDVLQKMKAAGFNTVTIVFDWGYHSPRKGVYDFSGVRDVDRLLDIAKDVGMYVIARPGPYINAETDAGGFPGWLTNMKGPARSTAPAYTADYKQWLTRIDRILVRHQLTNGTGTVILYQIENEFEYNGATTMGRHYMHNIEVKARADGITVPLTGNHDAAYKQGLGAVDIPGYDYYPLSLHCAHPQTWNRVRDFTKERRGLKKTPLYFSEYQGGGFGPWGGPGYAQCRRLTGPAFERVFYEANIASGATLQNFYMTYGGTNWGWLAAPIVHTSYDYAAAINAHRQLTPKYAQQKLLGYFTQTVQALTKTKRLAVNSPSNPALRLDGRVNPDNGTQVYILRHADGTSTADDRTHIRLDLANHSTKHAGEQSTGGSSHHPPAPRRGAGIPQQPGTALRISGRDSKMLLANYRFGRQHLIYSTSELMTDLTAGDRDVALFYGRRGEDGETVLHYPSRPSVHVLAGQVSSHWDGTQGRLRLNYRHKGLARVLIQAGQHKLLLLLADKHAAERFWKLETDTGPVLVRGPYLVRSAAIANPAAKNGVLKLTGDTDQAGQVEVFAPLRVTSLVWNGRHIQTSRTQSDTLVGRLQGPKPVTLPSLTDWKYQAGAPEIKPDFDDSGWLLADHAATNNPFWNGRLPILNGDAYGFHHGNVWYRGHFHAMGRAKGLILTAETGQHGVYTAWLNGHYLGTSPAGSRYFNVDPSYLKAGKDNVISVLVEDMGHTMPTHGRGYKVPRGLTSASFLGASPRITWRLQGNRGGETPIASVRGPFNNGGLYGERRGWSLPGYPDRTWHSVRLPKHVRNPGVGWYRTTFKLAIPKDQDVPIALKLSDDATRHYRALIFINGWQFGRYINHLGPQHVFALPPGILNPHGKNTIAIASWSTEHTGGLGRVSLVKLGNYRTSLRVHLVKAPGYDRGKYEANTFDFSRDERARVAGTGLRPYARPHT